jgi:hypothetical protein
MWIFLVAIGKRGFVHLILLTAIGTAVVELMAIYRARMTVREADKL